MASYEFVTVDVFTDRRFGGNPLAVFPRAQGLSGADMQALAAEFNLSETAFVLPPDDPAHTARVRIFTPRAEVPFAGHPNVGTALVLAARRAEPPARMVFEEAAGLVPIVLDHAGRTTATVEAPRPLALGAEVPVESVAACAGLRPERVRTAAHRPVFASVGFGTCLAEVEPDTLAQAAPDPTMFRVAAGQHPGPDGGFLLHLYARDGDRLRSRVFGPLFGIPEDPATGSANAALAALLLHLDPGRESAAFDVGQGDEMGRPSRMRATARRGPDGVRATVGGGAVPVLRGVVEL